MERTIPSFFICEVIFLSVNQKYEKYFQEKTTFSFFILKKSSMFANGL